MPTPFLLSRFGTEEQLCFAPSQVRRWARAFSAGEANRAFRPSTHALAEHLEAMLMPENASATLGKNIFGVN
jgi:hypothetical protein